MRVRHVASRRRFAKPTGPGSCRALALALVVAVAAGCSGSPGPSPAASADPGSVLPWERMTPRQKQDYMRSTVMPTMRELFVRFDPHRYPKMGCSPCHTRSSGTPDYRMPNDDLLLDPSTCEPGPGADPSAIAMNRFMLEEVGPTMGRLLGKPFNSCYWCHSYDP